MNKSEKSISLGFNLNPFQIKSTSVSRYITIEECRLKGALNAKGETKLLAYSIDHVFGDLIHKLMEN